MNRRHPLAFGTGQRGFTLVELVIVMVLLGIMAIVALPRLAGSDAFSEAGFHTEVVAALRYAQKTAVSHRRLVCAQLTSTTVTLQIAASNPANACGATLLPAPNGAAAFASTTRTSLALTAGSLPATLFFQPDGRITTNVAGSSLWTAGITVADQPVITIAGATGYVK
ncbi:MAG: prepilin-type cleavage/methylation domain-containing protein [Betaproteobacteria bacterium HGW-Betaproteobacteria-7]|jgi:MSHA pilin protein MshC|nr:MAG: prepilin-type cleavage/methylation domain-containing protein [Betaproteobacteria bacterium HGW-Betaproteobacteria-7]